MRIGRIEIKWKSKKSKFVLLENRQQLNDERIIKLEKAIVRMTMILNELTK